VRLRFKDAQGMHKARLSEIHEKHGVYGPYLRLVFTVIDGEYKDFRFCGIVKPTPIRQGRFYKWVTNILGHEPDEFSTEDLIGKVCRIYLSRKKDFYVVTDVFMICDMRE